MTRNPRVTDVLQREAEGAVSSGEEEARGSSNSHLQLLERVVVKMMEPNSVL